MNGVLAHFGLVQKRSIGAEVGDGCGGRGLVEREAAMAIADAQIVRELRVAFVRSPQHVRVPLQTQG